MTTTDIAMLASAIALFAVTSHAKKKEAKKIREEKIQVKIPSRNKFFFAVLIGIILALAINYYFLKKPAWMLIVAGIVVASILYRVYRRNERLRLDLTKTNNKNIKERKKEKVSITMIIAILVVGYMIIIKVIH